MFSLPFLRTGRRRNGSSDDRLGRICKVLDQLDLDYPPENPESALALLPPSPMLRNSGPAKLQALQLPLKIPGRVAVLDGGFDLGGKNSPPNIRELPGSAMPELLEYAPEAIVAPLDTALWLADRKLRGLGEIPSLRIAMVVTTRIDDTPLADHHRELLWHAFEVPIFEQLKAWDGTVIARECEVHDGLHVADREAILHLYDDELLVTQLTAVPLPVVRTRTGFTAEMVPEHCECGAETPRIRSVVPVKPKVMAAAGGRRG